MNRLLILGNGYDRALGLNTRYIDCLVWYFNEHLLPRINHSYSFKDGFWDFLIPAGTVIPKNVDESSIRDTYHLVHKNIVDKNFPNGSLLLGTIFRLEPVNWVDIEQIYYDLLINYSKRDALSFVKKLNQEVIQMEAYLIEYLKAEVSKDYYNPPFSPHILVKPYDPDIITGIPIITEKGKIDRIQILSFNYTNAFSALIPEIKAHGEIEVQINPIHGLIVNKAFPIIFGYGDEYDEGFKVIKDKEDDYLVNIKSYKYLKSKSYKNLRDFLNLPFEVIIFGHSCGYSDRVLLKTIFEHQNCVSIMPIVRESKPNEYFHKIAAISRNFEDMLLFRDRVISEQFCPKI